MLVEECEDTNPENTLKIRKRAAGTQHCYKQRQARWRRHRQCVTGSFTCQLDTSPGSLGKSEPQLKNCLNQIGLGL